MTARVYLPNTSCIHPQKLAVLTDSSLVCASIQSPSFIFVGIQVGYKSQSCTTSSSVLDNLEWIHWLFSVSTETCFVCLLVGLFFHWRIFVCFGDYIHVLHYYYCLRGCSDVPSFMCTNSLFLMETRFKRSHNWKGHHRSTYTLWHACFGKMGKEGKISTFRMQQVHTGNAARTNQSAPQDLLHSFPPRTSQHMVFGCLVIAGNSSTTSQAPLVEGWKRHGWHFPRFWMLILNSPLRACVCSSSLVFRLLYKVNSMCRMCC